MSSLKRITDAVIEPITLNEAKDWCRVDTNDENTLIESIIVAARQWCEVYTHRQFITATWVQVMDGFAGREIQLRICPLVSVTSITYLDSSGTQQTFSSSKYRVDTYSEPGRITLEFGEAWPVSRGVSNDGTITFKAGYGTEPSAVPQKIKTAIKLLVGHWYENREAYSMREMKEVGMAVRSLLDSECWSKVH